MKMKKKKEKRIYSLSQGKKFKTAYRFIAGKNQIQDIYCDIIRAALHYKFRNHPPGFAIPLSDRDMMINPVFELTAFDTVYFRDRWINGKKLREIFVTTMLAKYLDTLDKYDDFEIKDKMVTVGWEEIDLGTDTVISITRPTFFEAEGQIYQAVAGLSSLMFFIQVKEYVSYDEIKGKGIVYPKTFDFKRLNVGKLKSYEEFVLIYIRDFCQFNCGEILNDMQKYGLEGENIILFGQEYNGDFIPKNFVFFDLKRKALYYTEIGPCDLPLHPMPGPLI